MLKNASCLSLLFATACSDVQVGCPGPESGERVGSYLFPEGFGGGSVLTIKNEALSTYQGLLKVMMSGLLFMREDPVTVLAAIDNGCGPTHPNELTLYSSYFDGVEGAHFFYFDPPNDNPGSVRFQIYENPSGMAPKEASLAKFFAAEERAPDSFTVSVPYTLVDFEGNPFEPYVNADDPWQSVSYDLGPNEEIVYSLE